MDVETLYDTTELLTQAAQWRQKAALTDQPAMRDAYLGEALRYETMVQRSLEAPMFQDTEAPRPGA